jgi:flavin-dependent thymidylate synthase
VRDYSPEPDKDFFTPDWRNVEVGPPPGAIVPAVVELPEIDPDPEGANPDELEELTDGTFVPVGKDPHIYPDHHEVDPNDEPDDKPVYCWCPAKRGKHKWNPNGKCPNKGPAGLAGTIMSARRTVEGRLRGQDPERDPETGEPIPPKRPEREEPDLLPNQSPWFPTRDNPLYPGPLFFKESYMEPDQPGPTKDIQKWADVAMWKAPEHVDPQKPRVTVSMCTPNPLGVMAMVNAQYTGRNLTDPLHTTEAERREAWHAATVSRLSETPLEWIQWSINFENVSRAFTHQLVRTRMATYAQESQRFAVKDNVHESVKLPPSLAGTIPDEEFQRQCREAGIDAEGNRSREQRWRQRWDVGLDTIGQMYSLNVNDGMPAEDARGMLPTNMLTRIHMRVDMKTLLNLAGMRLCTQAQAEWRAVFAELAKAIREYGPDEYRWQMELISSRFRPVCFAANRCPMKAKSDRYCAIRDQVDAFEAAGVKSDRWEDGETYPGDPGEHIPHIRPQQWLAADAARVAPGGTR